MLYEMNIGAGATAAPMKKADGGFNVTLAPSAFFYLIVENLPGSSAVT